MAKKDVKIIFGKSNLPLAQNICKFLKIKPCKVCVDMFPDGESSVAINEDVQGNDVFIIQSCDSPANQNYMELFIMIDAARRASAGKITAVIPFFGYSRQDRKDRPNVPITAKLVANLLLTAGADRVLTLDLHAQQITGFFDIPVYNLFTSRLFIEYLRQNLPANLVVCSPDLGRTRMAVTYADALHCGFGVIVKRRMNSDQVEVRNIIGDIAGKNVLLTDDMSVTFHTLDEVAKLLKRHGACTVQAAVSHCLLTADGYSRFQQGDVDRLITTNSTCRSQHFQNCPKITILDVSQMLGEAILNIYNNKSVQAS